MSSKKSREIWQFGDFQTPDELAEKAIQVLCSNGFKPQTIIEPTCGKGAFLLAATKKFPHISSIGLDINKGHLQELSTIAEKRGVKNRINIIHSDFFVFDWDNLLNESKPPILFVGNPPWVTSAELGLLESLNLPKKSNFHKRKGIDAITGKSNFDISEWMIIQHLKWLQKKKGLLGVLCKTSVARKVLIHAWKHNYSIGQAKLYKIDALAYFKASVDACFFIIDCTKKCNVADCDVYESLDNTTPSHTIGYYNGRMLSNVSDYEDWKEMLSGEKYYIWRTGVKHDCSRIMELEKKGRSFCNGEGEVVELENNYIFPLFKSSDISNGRVHYRKHILVTQKVVGEDTRGIAIVAPKTWEYLNLNADKLDKRKSSIYKNKPRFSIFGVGEYTFSPWKVAISGLYKNLNFKILNPVEGKPVMVDDTVNFLPCNSKDEAEFLVYLLSSDPAKKALNSIIFWNDKRPITVEVLKQLNLREVARELSCEADYEMFVHSKAKNEEQFSFL